MQAAKHATATAKEKVQNTTAKVEEKMDKKKASAETKPEKVLATDEAGKEEAKARGHQKKAEAGHIKDEKVGQNKAETEGIKQDVDNRQAAAESAYQNPS